MNIKIGKYTLETLTTGMYETPRDIFREYIQNAADSIDNAVKMGILFSKDGKIEISINKEESRIVITDNGIGVQADKVEEFLLSIGDSKKCQASNRGFRGIGRLAGLAYCDQLNFYTSYLGERIESVVSINAKQLRNDLYSTQENDSLEETFKNAVTIERRETKKSKHFFSVELINVQDIDNILNEQAITEYVSQVAPVPFSPNFKWKDLIISKMKYFGYAITEYNISIGDEKRQKQIFKNYEDKFIADRTRKVEDTIEDVNVIPIINNNVTIALLWHAKTRFSGTVQNSFIRGIRMRKGNIQLGDKNVLNQIFKDERFNGWMVGELHLLAEELIPNARRDNIEKNDSFMILNNQLVLWADKIATKIRKISLERNSNKANKKIEDAINNVDLAAAKQLKAEITPEIIIGIQQEYDEIAHAELVNKIDLLIGNCQACTKYKSLNLQEGLNNEQKKILEIVFDILIENKFSNADKIVTTILKQFKEKSLKTN